jgi:hypothetical protein
LALDAQHAPTHLSLGRFMVMRAYRNGDDPAEGMRHLQQVIDSIAPPPRGAQRALLAQAQFYRGMGYRTMGDETTALTCFRTALEVLPSFEPALLAQRI